MSEKDNESLMTHDEKEFKELKDNKEKNQRESVWTKQDENLLKEWADHAICYKWLHENSYKKFMQIYTFLTIPVIILTTITGTANFAQGQIKDEELRDIFPMIIGGVSIFAAIISTITQTLKIAETKEGHYNSSKLWDKFYRNIQIELIKSRSERIPKKTMLEMSKKEYDRLIENSPTITDDVLEKFSKIFKDVQNITKPNMCDNLTSVDIYQEEEVPIIQILPSEPIKEIEVKIDEQAILEQEIKEKFREINSRDPTQEELYNIIELKDLGKPSSAVNVQNLVSNIEASVGFSK
jgi:hypothetical protein